MLERAINSRSYLKYREKTLINNEIDDIYSFSDELQDSEPKDKKRISSSSSNNNSSQEMIDTDDSSNISNCEFNKSKPEESDVEDNRKLLTDTNDLSKIDKINTIYNSSYECGGIGLNVNKLIPSNGSDHRFQQMINIDDGANISNSGLNRMEDEPENFVLADNCMEGTNINADLNLEKENRELTKPVSENLNVKGKYIKNYRDKKFRCKFCEADITSRNFVRHLLRHHNHEKEVKNALELPPTSKKRKQAIAMLRNDTNFNLYLKGIVRPKRQRLDDQRVEYYPCVYCKAIFTKHFLARHVKSCVHKVSRNNSQSKINPVALSQTEVACALDPTNTINRLDVKDQVFNMMRGDEISLTAKKDLLIVHYGESYLKSQKRERREYTCSNKLRELARLLLEYRIIVNNPNVSFKDILNPRHFDTVVTATRNLSGYDPITKTFKAPSIALHMGTTLKTISEELIHLIMKGSDGFQCNSPKESSEWRQTVKDFKKLVMARWNKEISSIANKDMNEKRWQKPLLVPLVSDVKIFREATLNFAKDCEKQFCDEADSEHTYKQLVQCTLALLILFNRRRIGDVQYLKIKDYLSNKKTDFRDFEATLSESEKILTKKYKRVVNGGKGSRAVVILIPESLQTFMTLLLKNRNKYISPNNEYVFALPNSKLKWAQGDVVIRSLTKKMNLENPAAVSSNKLRKHIATAMQVLSMSKDDCKQFSKFMGHTEKTHEEFYELPVDIYQTARVVKVLLMMEKGVPLEFKGKSLSEIDVDEYVVDNYNKDNNDSDETDNTLTTRQFKTKLKDKEITPLTCKSIIGNKICWNTEEISLLKRHFKKFITRHIYPSGEEIKQFIEETKSNRSVTVVRSKLQHLMKNRK